MSIIQSFFMAGGPSSLDVEVLMMGGGGGTTSRAGQIRPGPSDDYAFTTGGGGGGAGGLYIYSATLNPGSSSTVTIGGGGNGNTNGSVTSFTGASNAVGGGYGSASGTSQFDNSSPFTGIPGGSGGGGASGGGGGSGTPGQGNSGGGSSYVLSSGFGAGGGGGKGSAGVTAGTNNGAAGGPGYDLATFRGGTPLIVAFGGGGAGMANDNPSVGLNGDGSTTRSPAANTGGGSRNANGFGSTGTGGSGRVIVRYAGSTQKATGGTVTTATVSGNPYTIHDFTGNGTFSVT